MNLLSITGLLATILVVAGADDVYQPGPYEVNHKLYFGLFNSGLDHDIDVWAPAAEGSFPVIYFIPGLAGLIPAELYGDVLKQLAAHGYVVIGIWKLNSLPPSQVEAGWLKDVDSWLRSNLNGKLLEDEFNPNLVLDFTHIYLAAHSSGAHVAVNYLNKIENGCDNIRGLILLSPVDGLDPFGILDSYCIEPGQKLLFETPTLLMSVGLDRLPGIGEEGSWFPACAPDELSNMRFWNALNGEAWHINATLYGHGDMLIEFIADDVIGTLKNCATAGSPIPIYHQFVVGEIVAFLQGIEGNCEMYKYLEDPGLMPVLSTVMKQPGGQATCQDGGYCIIL